MSRLKGPAINRARFITVIFNDCVGLVKKVVDEKNAVELHVKGCSLTGLLGAFESTSKTRTRLLCPGCAIRSSRESGGSSCVARIKVRAE